MDNIVEWIIFAVIITTVSIVWTAVFSKFILKFVLEHEVMFLYGDELYEVYRKIKMGQKIIWAEDKST